MRSRRPSGQHVASSQRPSTRLPRRLPKLPSRRRRRRSSLHAFPTGLADPQPRVCSIGRRRRRRLPPTPPITAPCGTQHNDEGEAPPLAPAPRRHRVLTAYDVQSIRRSMKGGEKDQNPTARLTHMSITPKSTLTITPPKKVRKYSATAAVRDSAGDDCVCVCARGGKRVAESVELLC